MTKDYLIKKKSITSSDIIPILYKIYLNTYEKIKRDKEVVLCKMNVRALKEYKTDTPAKKLMQRIIDTNENYEFGKSIKYFHLYENSPRNMVYALDYELKDTPITMINLYKFYSTISKTMYTILAEAINCTNIKRNVYIPYTNPSFTNDNVVAFILAHESIEKNVSWPMNQ